MSVMRPVDLKKKTARGSGNPGAPASVAFQPGRVKAVSLPLDTAWLKCGVDGCALGFRKKYSVFCRADRHATTAGELVTDPPLQGDYDARVVTAFRRQGCFALGLGAAEATVGTGVGTSSVGSAEGVA